MKTLKDLLKDNKKELYGGLAGEAYIESMGLINAPRQAALLVNSPTTLGSLIGNELGGLVKGSAKRPSDTIFPNKKFFSKSVSLNPGAITGIIDSVEKGEQYYIKRNSSGDSVIGKIMSAPKSPKDVLLNTAASAAKNPLEFGRKLKKAFGKAKEDNKTDQSYHPSKFDDINGIYKEEEVKFSDFAPTYNVGRKDMKLTQTDKRGEGADSDTLINYLIRAIGEDDNYKNSVNLMKESGMPFVLFEMYPNADTEAKKILLPGTISGLTENASAQWDTFKYLGSPFNLYRYTGVERGMNFNLKMYYTDILSKRAMIKNLNKIRNMVFPTKLSAVAYGGSDSAVGTLAIKPNLMWLTISDIYTKILCIVESVDFSVDDSTSWPTIYRGDSNSAITLSYEKQLGAGIYPSVIDVSFTLKVIEAPIISNSRGEDGDFEYEYADPSDNYFTNMATIYDNINKKQTTDNVNSNDITMNTKSTPISNADASLAYCGDRSFVTTDMAGPDGGNFVYLN